MTRLNPFKAAVLTATALALPLTSACGGDDAADGSTTVKVGTLRGQPHLYQPFFYDDVSDGITFDVITFDSSPDIAKAVVSGAVDFGVTGVPSALGAIANGDDVTVVASAADGGSGFVARPGINSLGDLVGAKVGFPQGASQEVLLRLTLKNAGIDINGLQLVNLPFSDMATGLASGRIDAFLSAELGPSTAIKNGAHVLASPYETPVGKVNIGLITTGALVEKNPDLVGDVVGVHQDAVAYMKEHRDEWATGLVKDFGLDPQVTATAIDNIWLRSDLSEEYQGQVVELARNMNELGVLPSVPTAADIFTTTFVEPAAATDAGGASATDDGGASATDDGGSSATDQEAGR